MESIAAEAVTPWPGELLKGSGIRISYILVKGKIHHYPAYDEAKKHRDNIADVTGVRPRIIRSLNVSPQEISAHDSVFEMLATLRKCKDFTHNAIGHLAGADPLYHEICTVVERAMAHVPGNKHGEVE